MFAYRQEDNTVAICSKQTSIPEGAVWIETATVPDAPRESWRIVNDALVFDADTKSSIDAAKAKADLKMTGVEFEGVMCSAEAEDMWGLNAVQGYVAAGNSTPFKFENGNVLVLTPANMADFINVWTPFRASFFVQVI